MDEQEKSERSIATMRFRRRMRKVKYDLILRYTGHTEEGEIVYGNAVFHIFGGSLDEKGEFTSAGKQAAKEFFENDASENLGKSVICDTITLTAARENGKVVIEFPYGLGKPMYDSGWRDPSYIGAVKPFLEGATLREKGQERKKGEDDA